MFLSFSTGCQIAITKFNLTNYEEVLRRWNAIVDTMSLQCEKLGSACLKVYYEKLVLNPKNWLERIFRFLDLKWDDSVLHHEKYIASGDIILNT